MKENRYQELLTVQQYGPTQMIDGVELVTSPIFGDDAGIFAEVFRVNDAFVAGLKTQFEVRQISMSVMVPGTIKAYHVHEKQDDLWFVPPGNNILVNLHDIRPDSATFDVHSKMSLGGYKNQILRIPKGVAHGVANPYQKDMLLFYATNQQFNSQDPDEKRLPWDTFGAEVWELTKG